MDFQTPLIFVGIFALGCVLLFFVYKFGIKEKSYEEALAEQRQQTHALLGIKPNPKPKEKKNKKAAKKAKEKSASAGGVSEELDVPEHKKHHVEFKEEAEEVPAVSKQTPALAVKKKMKKEKVRSILIKDKSLEHFVISEAEAAPANHFDQIHPKDEFELLRSNSSEDLLKNKAVEVEKIAKKQVVTTQSWAPVETTKDERRPEPPATNAVAVVNSGKEKKKKKSEFNTLQQLTAGDWNGPNMPILQNLVRKAELSRSEVQILIDLLLNKQHEAPITLDEWSEGKSDPVQKLKKQLAEKEKLLAEEQQALAGAQTKLREIRAEQQLEKSQLMAVVRQSKEDLVVKQNEVGRLHQQCQQLQNQLTEEQINYRSLHEELTGVKLQRQQLEMHLTQAKEADAVIVQLQQDNIQIRNDVVVQLNSFKAEMEQKNEIIRQLEETRITNEQLSHQQENVLKMELSHVKDELNHLHQANQQLQDELVHLRGAKDDGERQFVADLNQMQSELTRLRQNGALDDKDREIKILNLHNQLDLIQRELRDKEKRFEAELMTATSVADQLRAELNEQKAKNDALRTRNWKVMEALNAAETRANSKATIKSNQESQRNFVERLFPEVEELKGLSDDCFLIESEKYLRKYIEDLRQSKDDGETVRLESQIQHYKNAIDKTEKLLTSLQQHIEQEEINWRVQLTAKTAELDVLKAANTPQLRDRLANLEQELMEEREEKLRIARELQEVKSRNGDMAAIEKLSEEVERLRGQLDTEKGENGDVTAPPKSPNSNTTNGPALIQYCISTSSSSAASSLGEMTSKKKKKGRSN